jgi:predicted flavoprotein YhiN
LGMSGPAILKLSAWGVFAWQNYQFTIFVNWLNDQDTADVEKTKRLKTGTRKKISF